MFTPTPPHNDEIEQAFLSEVLFGSRPRIDELAEILSPEHFYAPLHQQIWAAAVQCAEHGGPHTAEVLARILDAADRSSNGGARQYLADLRVVASGCDVTSCANHIRDLSLRREIMEACYETLTDAAVDDPSRTAADRVASAEARLFALAEGGAERPDGSTMAEAMAAADRLIERARQAVDGVSGVPTGLIDLDRRLGGLQGSELYVVAGRPGMGKTAMALTLAVNAAKRGRHVRIVSLEMSRGQLAQRYYARRAGISVQDQRRELTLEQQRWIGEARDALRDLPVTIDDGDGQTVVTIRARAKRQKRKTGIDLLIVDYLGLVRPTDARANKVHQIEEITTGLKRLSKELDIPVILLAQLNRGVEQRDDKRPSLADLRDSGAIEQDADVVMFLYREEYYLQRQEPDDPNKYDAWFKRLEAARGRAEVIVAKFRQGETGIVPVHFDGARQSFGNLSEER